MQQDPSRRRVIVGVDTHKYIHVAVALNANGGVIGSGSFASDNRGYTQLIDWAVAFWKQTVFAVEGTGSYGAGLAGAIRRRQVGVSK
jgi:transposase